MPTGRGLVTVAQLGFDHLGSPLLCVVAKTK